MFDSNFQNSIATFHLAAFAANFGIETKGKYDLTFVYTARYSGVVGYLYGSGDPTNYVSLVVKRLGTFDSQGRLENNAVSLFPGFPR